MRGMLYGAGIFAILALASFVRIGGDTPFNHLVGLFSTPEAQEEQSPKKPASKKDKLQKERIQKAAQKMRKATSVSGKNSAAQPRAVTTNAVTAPPLERTTDKDRKSLDKLVESKSE